MFLFAFAVTVINLTLFYKITGFNTQSINQNTCFEIIAKHLLLSDISCAIYIVFIAVGNIYINISATTHELYWRHHVVCYISCVLHTFFQMTSIAVIFFMAPARWLVAKYPLTSKLRHISFTTLCLRYISATILIFSISLNLFYIFNSDLQVIPNSLCTIFYDTLKNTISQQIILFLGLVQLNASIVVIVLHILLYITSYNSPNVLKSDSKLLSLRMMVFQIIFVTLCKCTCWFFWNYLYFVCFCKSVSHENTTVHNNISYSIQFICESHFCHDC